MKKGLKYLLLGALLVPVAVKADMGAPSLYEIDVVCNKTEGCHQYEYDMSSRKLKESGMASYGDRGKAQYSYEEDGTYLKLYDTTIIYSYDSEPWKYQMVNKYEYSKDYSYQNIVHYSYGN